MVILSLLLGLMTLPAIVVYHVFVRGKRSPADKSTAFTGKLKAE